MSDEPQGGASPEEPEDLWPEDLTDGVEEVIAAERAEREAIEAMNRSIVQQWNDGSTDTPVADVLAMGASGRVAPIADLAAAALREPSPTPEARQIRFDRVASRPVATISRGDEERFASLDTGVTPMILPPDAQRELVHTVSDQVLAGLDPRVLDRLDELGFTPPQLLAPSYDPAVDRVDASAYAVRAISGNVGGTHIPNFGKSWVTQYTPPARTFEDVGCVSYFAGVREHLERCADRWERDGAGYEAMKADPIAMPKDEAQRAGLIAGIDRVCSHLKRKAAAARAMLEVLQIHADEAERDGFVADSRSDPLAGQSFAGWALREKSHADRLREIALRDHARHIERHGTPRFVTAPAHAGERVIMHVVDSATMLPGHNEVHGAVQQVFLPDPEAQPLNTQIHVFNRTGHDVRIAHRNGHSTVAPHGHMHFGRDHGGWWNVTFSTREPLGRALEDIPARGLGRVEINPTDGMRDYINPEHDGAPLDFRDGRWVELARLMLARGMTRAEARQCVLMLQEGRPGGEMEEEARSIIARSVNSHVPITHTVTEIINAAGAIRGLEPDPCPCPDCTHGPWFPRTDGMGNVVGNVEDDDAGDV